MARFSAIPAVIFLLAACLTTNPAEAHQAASQPATTTATPVSAPELPIKLGGKSLGAVEQFRIEPDPDNESRILLSLRALLDDFPAVIDEVAPQPIKQGNSCSQRLFWRSGTTIRGVSGGGSKLELTSKIRYETWFCTEIPVIDKWFKTETGTVSTDFFWRLSVAPASFDKLRLTAEVTDVKGVPPLIEEWLNLRVVRHFDIPIPPNCGSCNCNDILGALKARFGGARFEISGHDVTVIATTSVEGDLTPLLACTTPGAD